jgi:hypothetical protein
MQLLRRIAVSQGSSLHQEAPMRQFYALLFAFLFLCVSSASSRPSREIHKTLPLHSDGCLVVDTYKGSITVTTHDQQQVEVDVRIESDDDSDSWDAARDVKDTEIEINGDAAEVTLRTNYRELERQRHPDFWDRLVHLDFSNSRPLVHYTIKMPRTATLKIKDYKSRTRIEDLRSNLTFTTYKGEAEINNLAGGIDAETYKGSVRVSFSHIKNDCRLETQKGRITIALPKGNGFDLQTDFGRHVDFSTDFDVQLVNRNNRHAHDDYRGNVNGGGPRLRLKSDKGDIRLIEK